MLHTQLLRDSSGNNLSSYNINTTNVITTEGVDTQRNEGNSALLIVQDGSITEITRQVSIDNTNWYTPYGVGSLSLSQVGSAIPDSRMITLSDADSSNVIAPYTRFKFAGARTITTVSMWYIQEEQSK